MIWDEQTVLVSAMGANIRLYCANSMCIVRNVYTVLIVYVNYGICTIYMSYTVGLALTIPTIYDI